ncbi:MAG: histidinol dehydrogenase [Xanthomonadales bacterium]|nr:histidinol dehydrogenase [Xanthomonadales bacterium]NIX13208.1 histidinol dehydrogenase [Xanthomonadales bacterium]
MKRLDWNSLDATSRARALARPGYDTQSLRDSVAAIVERVRKGGDDALRALTREFDGCEPESIEVSASELTEASRNVDPSLTSAIDEAAGRIEAFHAASRPVDSELETAPGLVCRSRQVPLDTVGLYIPGGSAPLISTVLMLAIPASLAGCREVVLCTPPDGSGGIHPAILYAAGRCGVDRVFRAGGAQAIAAMAYGTESVPRCSKLFGPGNAWVTEAKRQAAADPAGAAQDMPAGPSEVMVIADASADVQSVCWDLLSQAEHGPDSQSIVISDSDELLDGIEAMMPGLGRSLPRAEILEQSLAHARLIRVDDLGNAVEISNAYAPEHLILNCGDADKLSEGIMTAGSVFVGPWTPESLGDYCSGTNHVLPTNGHARAYSGLSVADFQRRMTIQQASAEGLREAGPAAMALAAAEGLEAHRMAVAWRLQSGEGA